MQYQTLASNGFPSLDAVSPMARELSAEELADVSGGSNYSIHIGTAVTLAGAAAGFAVAAPVVAGTFAIASIGVSAISIFSSLNGLYKQSAQ